MQDQVRLGALCWVLSMSFLCAQFLAQLAAPDHHLLSYDISLLGISTCGVHEVATSGSTDVVCSPLHAVFNGGIILHGILVIVGAWCTRKAWPQERAASWGLRLLALGGAGAMVVGAYPLDSHMTLHVIGAVLAIAASGLGLLLLAYSLRHQRRVLAHWSFLVGTIILLAGLGHALGGLPFGRGAMERLAVWPQTLWYVATGLFLLSAHPSPIPTPTVKRTNSGTALWPHRTGQSSRTALPKTHV